MLYWPSTNGVTVVPGSSSARAGVLRIGVAIDDELRGVVADVHGRCAGDRDGFLERADLEFGADRRVERALQDDAVAPDGLEPGQREGDAIGPGRQIDNAVVARGIGHRGAGLLDERRAGRFHGDARQHGAARVLHGSGDARLGIGRQREDQHAGKRAQNNGKGLTHSIASN
jgi:hypothetical protein